MILAIDIGNSSISLGVFDFKDDNYNLICRFKMTTRNATSDEYEMSIRDFLKYNSIDIITDSAISSVVPSLTAIISNAVKNITGRDPFVIGAGIKTGFDIRIKKTDQLGADLVANASYAISNYCNSNIVILDVGTATTLSLINTNNEFLGTIISPGIKVSFNALSLSAAQIEDISFNTDNDTLIGRTSEESVRSGVLNGQAIMIDGFIRNIREMLDTKNSSEKLVLLATGGLCEYILPRMRNKFTYCQDMTLQGIIQLYKINRN